MSKQSVKYVATIVDEIRPGDRVTFRCPLGSEKTGRAVMKSKVGGWVLNMGGKHGTPAIVDETTIISVKKARR